MPWGFGRGRRDASDRQDTGASLASLRYEARLGAIGEALDAHPEPLRDLAISLTSERSFISVLARHSSLYQGGWASVTYRIEELADGPGAAESARQPLHARAGGSWTMWLGAVGLLLDEFRDEARDVRLLEVEGGAVVDLTVRSPDSEAGAWSSVSREFTSSQVQAAMAVPRAGPVLRPARLIAFEGSR